MENIFGNLFRKHKLFLIIFFLLVIIRIPLISRTHEYALLAQDYNPTNFGMHFWHNDLPAADDVEVGENSRYFGFSSAYYYVPMFLYKIGVPFEFFNVLHLVLGLPLFLLAMYFLSYAIIRNQWFAAFSALFFYTYPGLFKLNLSYTLDFDNSIYSGDVMHIPAALFLAFLFSEKYIFAGISVLLLTLLNPTYGATAIVIVFVVAVYKVVLTRKWHESANGLAIALIGMVIAFIMVRLATPVHAPVSDFVRNFCIRIYKHSSPHTHSPAWFAVTLAFILTIIGAGFVFERFFRRRIHGEINFHLVGITKLFALIAVFYTVGIYFFLYTFYPQIFIIITPSKSMFFLVMIIGAYLALILYHVLAYSNRIISFFIAAAFAILLYKNQSNFFTIYKTTGKFFTIWSMLFLAVVFLGIISLIYILRKTRTRLWATPVAAVTFLMLGLVVFNSVFMMYNPALSYASALYDIELQINNALPENAILAPYSVPGTSNPYGMLRNSPIRTYSRRGALIYWSFSRNAYFNSQRRMDMEQIAYGAAGIDLWGEIERDANLAKKSDPLLYYLGIETKPSLRLRKKIAPPLEIIMDKMGRFGNYIKGLNINEFISYARRIGATHILICRQPGIAGSQLPSIVENPYFAVVEIPPGD